MTDNNKTNVNKTLLVSKAIRGGVMHAKTKITLRLIRTICNTSDQFTPSTSLHYFNFIPRNYSKDIAIFEGLKPAWYFAICSSAKFLLSASQTLYTDCKSERFVLALKMGPFRWVKYSPIFESNLPPLNQGQYSSITFCKADLDLRPVMGRGVGWNSLLIELFWPKLCSNGSKRGNQTLELTLWATGIFGLKQIFLILSVAYQNL